MSDTHQVPDTSQILIDAINLQQKIEACSDRGLTKTESLSWDLCQDVKAFVKNLDASETTTKEVPGDVSAITHAELKEALSGIQSSLNNLSAENEEFRKHLDPGSFTSFHSGIELQRICKDNS